MTGKPEMKKRGHASVKKQILDGDSDEMAAD